MAFIDIIPGQPSLKKEAVACGDVSGIIGLTGEVHGSLPVAFSFNLLKDIMSNMLGETISDISDDVKDAAGEMTNMICGDARRASDRRGQSGRLGSCCRCVMKINHEY
jgi:chemotaxis protein CheX